MCGVWMFEMESYFKCPTRPRAIILAHTTRDLLTVLLFQIVHMTLLYLTINRRDVQALV